MPASPLGDVATCKVALPTRRYFNSAFITKCVTAKPQNQVENTQLKMYTENVVAADFPCL